VSLVDAAMPKVALPTSRPNNPLSSVGADWPTAVRFELSKVKDGKLEAAGVGLDWSKLRLPALRIIPGNGMAEWEIPASAPHVRAYRARLLARPSFARAVEEARPYRAFFPGGAPGRD
jgi:hypothetical protein